MSETLGALAGELADFTAHPSGSLIQSAAWVAGNMASLYAETDDVRYKDAYHEATRLLRSLPIQGVR